MKKQVILSVATLISILLVFMNFSQVYAVGGSKTWGTPQTIQENILVTNNDEIPKGKAAWVFSFQRDQNSYVRKSDWEAMLSGDMTFIKNEIDSSIPGVKVRWIQVKWDSAEEEVIMTGFPPHAEQVYAVQGFYVEAIVENIDAGLTGIEIVAIIMAVAFLAAVFTVLFLTIWVTHQLVLAVSGLPPIFQIPTYIILLVFFGLFLLVLFGKVNLSDMIRAFRGKK